MPCFPASLSDFLASGARFERRLQDLKQSNPLQDFGWYPYSSLTAAPLIARLLDDEFGLVSRALAVEPLLDAGCGDGDLAFLFESLGAEADAIDLPQANFNQMRGLHALKRLLGSEICVHACDLDRLTALPRPRYGLVLFLGTLYHLKNPFLALETFAQRCAYAIVSTRVARVTRAGGARMEGEPLAYLLDPREANNDPTNFWIFSESGLLRLASRAGWAVRNVLHLGCEAGSNPVDADADERVFLFLRSRIRFPDMHVRIMEGWHRLEEESWRWTKKEFSFEVLLPDSIRTSEFALAVVLPEFLGPVAVSCEANGALAGRQTLEPGEHEFRGVFPPAPGPYELRFRVQHGFTPAPPDRRDLGLIVRCEEDPEGAGLKLPFRIS